MIVIIYSLAFNHILSAAHALGSFDILDTLLEALLDTVKMIPFLFVAFWLMEFIEHKAGSKLETALEKVGGGKIGGSLIGSVIGCVPQCGFSVAAANLYSGRLITMGTLISVFISTSDEAIPVLLAHPDKIGAIWKLLLVKIIIAAAAGVIIDICIHLFGKDKDEKPDFEEFCAECGCGSHGLWYSAMKHTVKITAFILVINVILGLVMGIAGEEAISEFLEKMGILQPFASALVGLIPNCAASVLITELYADGVMSFGSAVSGLVTGAGIGMAVLFRSNKNMRENFTVLGLIYFIGVVSGSIINIFVK